MASIGDLAEFFTGGREGGFSMMSPARTVRNKISPNRRGKLEIGDILESLGDPLVLGGLGAAVGVKAIDKFGGRFMNKSLGKLLGTRVVSREMAERGAEAGVGGFLYDAERIGEGGIASRRGAGPDVGGMYGNTSHLTRALPEGESVAPGMIDNSKFLKRSDTRMGLVERLLGQMEKRGATVHPSLRADEGAVDAIRGRGGRRAYVATPGKMLDVNKRYEDLGGRLGSEVIADEEERAARVAKEVFDGPVNATPFEDRADDAIAHLTDSTLDNDALSAKLAQVKKGPFSQKELSGLARAFKEEVGFKTKPKMETRKFRTISNTELLEAGFEPKAVVRQMELVKDGKKKIVKWLRFVNTKKGKKRLDQLLTGSRPIIPGEQRYFTSAQLDQYIDTATSFAPGDHPSLAGLPEGQRKSIAATLAQNLTPEDIAARKAGTKVTNESALGLADAGDFTAEFGGGKGARSGVGKDSIVSLSDNAATLPWKLSESQYVREYESIQKKIKGAEARARSKGKKSGGSGPKSSKKVVSKHLALSERLREMNPTGVGVDDTLSVQARYDALVREHAGDSAKAAPATYVDSPIVESRPGFVPRTPQPNRGHSRIEQLESRGVPSSIIMASKEKGMKLTSAGDLFRQASAELSLGSTQDEWGLVQKLRELVNYPVEMRVKMVNPSKTSLVKLVSSDKLEDWLRILDSSIDKQTAGRAVRQDRMLRPTQIGKFLRKMNYLKYSDVAERQMTMQKVRARNETLAGKLGVMLSEFDVIEKEAKKASGGKKLRSEVWSKAKSQDYEVDVNAKKAVLANLIAENRVDIAAWLRSRSKQARRSAVDTVTGGVPVNKMALQGLLERKGYGGVVDGDDVFMFSHGDVAAPVVGMREQGTNAGSQLSALLAVPSVGRAGYNANQSAESR